MKIYVTGEKGQLGQCLLSLGAIPMNGFTPDPGDVVINAAAMTDHKRCQDDEENAWQSNVALPRLLGKICKNNSARLIHISTDYVFNTWDPGIRFSAGDPKCPVPGNFYAHTKLAGELAIQSIHGLKYHIVRTSWLLSPFRKAEWLDMHTVWNQIGSITWAPTLASALIHLAHDLSAEKVLHFTSSYSSSRAIFAAVSQMKEEERGLCLSPVASVPCPSDRPFNSALKPSPYFDKFIMEPEAVLDAYRKTFPYQKQNV